jgi:hypothetical protein
MADTETTTAQPAAGTTPPPGTASGSADLTPQETDLLGAWRTATTRGGMTPEQFNQAFTASRGAVPSVSDYISYVQALPEPAAAAPASPAQNLRPSRVRGTAATDNATAENSTAQPRPSRVRGTAATAAATAEPAIEQQRPSRVRGTAVAESAAAADTAEDASGSGAGTDETAEDEPTLYTDDPDLLSAHALLGSLVHAPAAYDELEKFVEPADFANPDLRAVFMTVRGLWMSGELADVVDLGSPAARLEAANHNQLRVMEALQSQRFTGITVVGIPRLMAEITAAAPPESVPFRGVYDPRAQIRLGRMVLEDSIRRRVSALGVSMRTRAPHLDLRDIPRQDRPAQSVRSNLAAVADNLEAMSERLARAIDRTGPAAVSGDAAIDRAAQAIPRRGLPTRPGPLAALRLQHAERNLIHVALHSGLGVDSGLQPQDFVHPRHANTWHAIQRLRDRGEPVNAVSVFYEVRTLAARPVLSDRQLMRMTLPPPSGARITRSLRTVVDSALNRAAAAGRKAMQIVAADRAVPVEGVLAQAKKEVVTLADRATTAAQQHRMITDQQQGRSVTR